MFVSIFSNYTIKAPKGHNKIDGCPLSLNLWKLILPDP